MKASGRDPVIRNKFARPVDPMAVGLDWGRRGFRCRRMLDPAGREWPGIVHGADELVMVLKGRLEIDIAGVLIDAEEGDEIFIPAGAVHSVRNTAPTATRWLYGYEGAQA
jgi:mannose-6-phosphate isomerase-like protein (cupin superfamily)